MRIALILLVTWLVVLGDLANWTRAAESRGDAARGEELFGEKGCNGCHQVNGIGGQVGPDLSRVFKLDLAKDRPGQKHEKISDYVRESLKDPQAYVVPGFPKPSPMPSADVFALSEQDIDDLIAYLRRTARSASTR